ncbi:MAG TPA: hypothetical protein VFF70_04440 [Anaerolineae bacterium]|nr:hypothetical protein [Anaerolineae bacterium]
MRRDRVYDLVATLCLMLAGIVAVYYLIVFVIPQSQLNPWSPIEMPIAVNSSEVLASSTPEASPLPTSTATVTLTPTSTSTPIKVSSTMTFTPAPTVIFTRTLAPTTRPRSTITSTPDICSTLKLQAPKSGQHYNLNDSAQLSWTFARVLAVNEHFDVLFDPPGQGIGSLAWADEDQPGLKNCTTRCTYSVGLGRYPGGRFNWTIGVIVGGRDHQVSAQVCKPPDPFNFTYLTLQ